MSDTIRQAMRAAREAAGISIGNLARSATFSESHLRNVENGNRAVTREIAEAYDLALGTGGFVVDLFVAEDNGDDLKRRALLGVLGTVIGLGVTAPQLVSESLRESLLSALGGEDWQEISAEYGRRFMTDPPPLFRTQLTGDLLVLRHSIMTTDSIQTRLAAPRLMTLHGMVLANLGDTPSAARWYRAARLAADRTGKDDIRQWVRGREAFRRGYEGATPHEVLAVASGVEDVEAKLATAQAYARIGESAQARRALDEARRVHMSADQSATTIYAMPPWRMALSAAYVYALMGDVKGCDTELTTVTPPNMVKRWEAQLEIQRAVAYARSGDSIAGMQAANSVIRNISEEQRSVVLVEMYREVQRCAQECERHLFS